MEHTCCFFGHRTIEDTPQLRVKVYTGIRRLIVEEKIDTFLFGSKSAFDTVCLETVTALKEQFPHIRRVYVRAEYAEISDAYRAYLGKWYEDSYYPARIRSAGKAVYVERNQEMIDNSRFCVVYDDPSYAPAGRKSGTHLAHLYARKQKKEIWNVFE